MNVRSKPAATLHVDPRPGSLRARRPHHGETPPRRHALLSTLTFLASARPAGAVARIGVIALVGLAAQLGGCGDDDGGGPGTVDSGVSNGGDASVRTDGGAGGDDDAAVQADSGTSSGGLDIDDVSAALAGALCEKLTACAGQLAVDAFLGGEACVERFTATVADGTVERWKLAVAAGTVTYDPAAAEACVDAYGELGCDFGAQRDPAACRDAVRGTVAMGGACSLDEECVGEAFCDVDLACPGACAPRQSAGGACERNDACTSGHVCHDGECVAPRTRDQSCGAQQGPCELGLACLGEEDGRGGTCKHLGEIATASIGESCGLEGPLCEAGASCVVDAVFPFVNLTCVGASASGGACKAGFPDPCPTDEYCDAAPAMGELDGTCRALPTSGDCAPGLDPNGLGICARGYLCVADSCVRRARIGEPCGADAQCDSGACGGGACVVPQCEG